jgi:hypothetical protein
MFPIYVAESALVTEANAHFIGLCTKASQGGRVRWKIRSRIDCVKTWCLGGVLGSQDGGEISRWEGHYRSF